MLNKAIVLGIVSAVAIAFAVVFSFNMTLDTDVSVNDAVSKLSSDFAIPVAVASEYPSGAPNVAIDKNSGKLYVVYIAKEEVGHNLYLKTSTDGGKSFSNGILVNDKPGDVFLDGRVSPNVAIGPQGQIYVLWVKSDPAPELFMGVIRSLVFAHSTDGGNTFSPSINIAENEQISGKSFHSLDVSSDGKIYVGWLDSPAALNEDGQIISDDSRPSTVRFARSTDGGNSFEQSIEVDSNPCPCCNVHVLSESDRSVYISWRKIFENSDGTTIRDMVVARSTDGGMTFSNPSKISNDGFEFDGCVHVGAPMALDSKGRLHVVWYTGKPESPGIFYAVSSDNAKSFSSPKPILTGDWVPPLRVQLTVDKNDHAWITWEDATGLSADEQIWRYDKTQAMIYVATVSPDGNIVRSNMPLNQVEGKAPAISSGNGLVSVVWAGADETIQCSSLPT
jgi:hypothetical protein